MKIFEINWESQGEKEWIAADTNIEALKFYCRLTGMDIDDFDDEDSIIEIPKSKWTKYHVKEEDEEKSITFKRWMKENHTPDIIAGTMYEV
jgi:hypothetical protein